MHSPLPTLETASAPAATPPAAGEAVRRYAGIVALALAVTLAQTLLTCAVCGRADPVEAYRSLHQWDSKWYARLAEQGYPDTLPQAQVDMAKLGFFPGYPLFCRVVARLAGLRAADGTLLAAQLACWGFWTYVLLFLQRWSVHVSLVVTAAAAILVHPCAFFLVAGYSESLFLLAVLGFLYWSSVRGPAAWCLAALHGVAMTGTRIVGLPLAACPLLIALTALWGSGLPAREWLRRLGPAAMLAGVALLGGLIFFGFCQWQYGRWDAYMYTQRAGWGVTPDYLALFKAEVYRVGRPTLINGFVNPNDLSRLCVPFTVVLFFALVLVECRVARTDPARGWRQRLGFYLAGGLMFYIAVSGLANSSLVSMIRYTFCVHVMLALAVVHLLGTVPPPRGLARAVGVGLLLGAAVVSMTCEVMLVRLFTHGEWVA
jgi:hypothetical protein